MEARKQTADILSFLLDAGLADPNQIVDGQAPLDLLVWVPNPEVPEALLRNLEILKS